SVGGSSVDKVRPGPPARSGARVGPAQRHVALSVLTPSPVSLLESSCFLRLGGRTLHSGAESFASGAGPLVRGPVAFSIGPSAALTSGNARKPCLIPPFSGDPPGA